MPDSPEAVMIFAAGRGTRMGALTRDRPKPLIEVAGKPLIAHALAQAEACDAVRRVVVNAHYHADKLIAALAAWPDVQVAREAELLDTGGGLQAALPLLGDGPVYTLNADAVWTGPGALTTLAAAWDPARMEGVMLLVPPERMHGDTRPGDFDLDRAGRLRPGGHYRYTGAQILRTDRLRGFAPGQFSLWRLWQPMLEAGTLFGVIHPGAWCDVGHPAGIDAAEAMLEAAADG